MKVTVVGAGGVGGYFGGRLVQGGADVTFLARGAHLEAIREHGLQVRSVKGDFTVPARVTDDPGEAAGADFVLVTVKTYDTDDVAGMLPTLCAEHTAVVSLQNGVANEERFAEVVGEDRVVGGAAYIFATRTAPGVVEHTGGPASVVVGEWRGGSSDRVVTLVDTFKRAGVTASQSPDIRSVKWSKLAFICAQAGTTAAVRLPIGDIRKHPASRELFRRLVADVCAVAAAEGVRLPSDLPERTLALADGLAPDSYSSLHHDLVSGNRMELDTLIGEVVRRGERDGVAVPTSCAIYGVLQPWAARSDQG